MTDEMLKLHTEKTFIKKNCDRTANNVRASLITAASKMANASDLVSEADTLDVLIDAFGVREIPEVVELIGMGPQFVKPSIGYSVDFNDVSAVMSAYNAEKETYDQYYGMVAKKVAEKKSSLDDSSKTM